MIDISEATFHLGVAYAVGLAMTAFDYCELQKSAAIALVVSPEDQVLSEEFLSEVAHDLPLKLHPSASVSDAIEWVTDHPPES